MAASTEFSDFLRYLSEHPTVLYMAFSSVAVFFVSAIGFTWAVARFFWNRDVNRLKQDLLDAEARHSWESEQQELNSKHMPLIDEEFPSLNELLDPIQLRARIPDKQSYDSDLNVITLAPSELGPWRFEISSPAKVFDNWFGEALKSNANLKEGYKFIEAEAELPCSLWKGQKASVVKIDKHPIIQMMYPFIILRRLTNDDNTIDHITQELVNFITWLKYWEQATNKTMNFKIQKLFWRKDFAYLRGYFNFDNLKVDGSVQKRYFLLRQILIRKIGAHRYVIYTGFPNKRFQDPYYDHLKEWWENFRIVQD
jgi:hypothetical protein